MPQSSQSDTYVYDGLEVVLTGRTAKREIGGTGRTTTRVDLIHEITPASKEDGSWKKWVRMNDLYKVAD